MRGIKRLPFAERNEQDYEDLTQDIQGAIATIRKSRSIPATQEKLAELAGCTRKTLHNRVWPITELKKIKEERKVNGNSKSKKTSIEHRLSTEKHILREKQLIGQVRNLQSQNGKLFDRAQELEEQNADLIDSVKVFEDEIAVLKDVKRELEEEVRRLKQNKSSGINVIDMQTVKKNSKKKKG